MKLTLRLLAIFAIICFYGSGSSLFAQKAKPGQKAKDTDKKSKVVIEDKEAKSQAGKVKGKEAKAGQVSSGVQKETKKAKGKGQNKSDKEYGKGKGKVKVEQSKGHAYGKDKQGLSGREFGQKRAAEAKLQSRKRLNTAEKSISESDEILSKSRQKLNRAKKEMQDKVNSGGYNSDQEADAKREKIKAAEERLKTLEEKIKRGKTSVQKKKSEIESDN